MTKVRSKTKLATCYYCGKPIYQKRALKLIPPRLKEYAHKSCWKNVVLYHV